jgi:hypothetical protein
VTAAGAAVLVAFVGTGMVLAVQTRANADLKRANGQLAIANAKVTGANTDLRSANERERQRFELEQKAIRMFHAGISEDLLLKQGAFKVLRTKLLRGAREFYCKPDGLLKGQSARDSQLALAEAFVEVGGLRHNATSRIMLTGVRRMTRDPANRAAGSLPDAA